MLCLNWNSWRAVKVVKHRLGQEIIGVESDD